VTAQLRELLDLFIRWVHLIAGIMWIGNSMLFNWLDRNLEKPAGNSDPNYQGKIWLLHSGAFYDVDKRLLRPNEMPAKLHWFKWQNFATWASGIGLLFVVYYSGGGALLIDPAVRALGPVVAITISLTFIVVSWFFYDLVWISPLAKKPFWAAALSFVYMGTAAFLLTKIFSGRAAYIHVGVILGTLMTGNVWFVIVPSQKELVAATTEGREQDASISLRAKERSIHNNYMTFPLLFMMISNHFPSTYGGRHAWIILFTVAIGGALSRHVLNIRFNYKSWLPAFGLVVLGTVVSLFILTKPEHAEHAHQEQIAFHTVQAVMHERCLQCHSAHPTDDVWKSAPSGVMFDTPDQIKRLAPRIKERAVISRTMPLQNKTQITQSERDLIGDWIDEGAPLD
jgi:uncharacterized membrane protein